MDLTAYRFSRIREDSELVLYRGTHLGLSTSILLAAPASRKAEAVIQPRLEHELSLADDLDHDWAIKPRAMVRHEGRAALLYDDPGGEPLETKIAAPLSVEEALDVAISIADCISQHHAIGLIHRDLKPAHILITEDGGIRLTGFGLSTKLSRERHSPAPPEDIAGTLAYMSPEQSGRTNRTIDKRSDLYSLGVILFELITGYLPFAASDPMEWIYCHVARPAPEPASLAPKIPADLNAIVLKLLSKSPEDRYQTAGGLAHDLRACREALNRGGQPVFSLGEKDLPDQLLIPEKLYGRDAHVERLIHLYHRVSKRGAFEFALISGYSGVGKSAVVDELHRSLLADGGLFAAGKFDQHNRNIPYAPLADAFRGLTRWLMSRPAPVFEQWKRRLAEALGANGQLLIDLVPEIASIVGDQPALEPLLPEEEKARFFLVVGDFLRAVARPEHPLVLFLDDLQWLDPATLALVEQLVVEGGIPNSLLIGAYRTNDVDEAHILSATITKIRSRYATISELDLFPLALADIEQLVSDTLHAPLPAVAALAALVFQKTEGNPFFAAQFLTSLYDEGLLSFDVEQGAWHWDLTRIGGKAITNNVAELMATRLARHEGEGLAVLQHLSLLGGSVRAATLGYIVGMSESATDELLREFVRLDLVKSFEGRYAFVHDRVQEAAYALIALTDRESMHLSIGRKLAERADHNFREDEIFEIVGHYNRGSHRIQSLEERLYLAELNLVAGKRAKSAAAFQAALDYFLAGCSLLPEGGWSSCYWLIFELEYQCADCRMILGDVDAAAEQFALLSERCRSTSDLARVVSRQVVVHTYQGRIDHALYLSLDCLARMEVDIPAKPTPEQVEFEYKRLLELVGDRDTETLAHLPTLNDRNWSEKLELLVDLCGPAGVLEPDLLDLALLRIANISLEQGMSECSVHAFANVGGRTASWRFGDFAAGNKFANLAIALIEERGFDRYASRAYAIVSGVVAPWNIPLRDAYDIARRAIEMPRERGGVTYSGYAWVCGLTAWLGSGKPLNEIVPVAEIALEFAIKSKFSLVVEFITTQLTYARSLSGTGLAFGDFSTGDVPEEIRLRRLEAEPHFRHALTRHRIRHLQIKYLAGRYEDCLAIIEAVGLNPGDSPVLEQSPVFEVAEYCFYSALARAAVLTTVPRSEWGLHFEAITENCGHLADWSQRCPANFSDRHALVVAEIARLEGRLLDAERHYEDAIKFAQEHGMLQNEALANELASRFHASRGFETIAQAYLRNARTCYARWGADRKVEQLDEEFPHLGLRLATHAEFLGSEVKGQHLDLAALVAMYQAVSGEIMLDRLIERLMETVIEYAAAGRGLLFLDRDGEMQAVAEAVTTGTGVEVKISLAGDLAPELPRSVLNYVTHSQEAVIIGDARDANRYSADPYVKSGKLRSVLSLPLIKQRQLVGVLYLDNEIASHVFTPDRLSVLQLLASQAAISIQNAEYFRDVQNAHEQTRRAETELRAAFDMMPILAWRTAPDGTVEFANRQWEEFTGSPVLAGGQERWLDAFHPDDIDKVSAKWRQLIRSGIPGEIEARMRRHDGEFRSFLVRATPMRNEAGVIVKWHGTNTDIEVLRRAEQAQEAMARVSRITAMGELTVSIAHEVNQPLMAIVTNAATCLSWLEAEPQNIPQARLAAERIVRDGHRAGDVIASIRALAKKSAPSHSAIDINETIAEVLALTENELARHGIVVDTALAPAGAWVCGDPVQMQQLILNLILNGVEAINATQDGPRIVKVSSIQSGSDHVDVIIADTGIGIQPEQREKIFEVFFTTKKDGIGIGLSICRSIVEAHRGTIWSLDNEPRGTAVHFRLPALEEGHAK